MNGKQQGNGDRHATAACRTKSKAQGTSQRRRIKGIIPGRLDHARAVGDDVTAGIDEQSQHHVALDALDEQGARVSERKIVIEDLWKDVRRIGTPPTHAVHGNRRPALGTTNAAEVQDAAQKRQGDPAARAHAGIYIA